MRTLEIEICRAYANGALDGYNTGTDNNTYDPEEKPAEHRAYRMGYDYGVTMYCQNIEGENNE
jgi:hypothetical protein